MKTKSTRKILDVLANMKNMGCDAAILACTELPLAINEQNSPLPIIDSTRLLAEKALEYSLSYPNVKV